MSVLDKSFDEIFNENKSSIIPRKSYKDVLIAAADCETNQFGDVDSDGNLREIKPFCWGLKISNGEYYQFYGDNCTLDFLKFIVNYEHYLKIFIHNGGRFDLMFFLQEGIIFHKVKIIGARLISAKYYNVTFRDSLAMIPVALKNLGDNSLQKINIDYSNFSIEKRDQFKDEILDYLKMDCEVLLNIVNKFINEFGDKLTIGTAAISELKKCHKFNKSNLHDENIIRDYYLGGRVQCFKLGINNKHDINIFDVNSMYPFVMKFFKHATFENNIQLENPKNSILNKDGTLADNKMYDKDDVYFITISGKFIGDYAHFPIRKKSGLDFETFEGEYKITSHELKIALKYKQFIIYSIKEIIICPNNIIFDDFVDIFIEEKIRYENENNNAMRLFMKLILNSAYGKFGQNPDNFYDYVFKLPHEINFAQDINDANFNRLFYEIPDRADLVRREQLKNEAIKKGIFLWDELPVISNEYYLLFRKKINMPEKSINDTFVAASITGAARSIIMEQIILTKNVIYCDTDSIVCEHLNKNAEIHNTKLGAWNLEASGDCFYLYGKKFYCLYKNNKPYLDKNNNEKIACKGVKLTASEIRELVLGINLEYSESKKCFVKIWKNLAPTFSLNNNTTYIAREIVQKNFDKN